MMQIKGNSEVVASLWPVGRVRRFRECDQRVQLQRPDLHSAELRPLGGDQGPRLPGEARREPLQAWLRRRHRQPQRPAERRGRGDLQRQPRRGGRDGRGAPDGEIDGWIKGPEANPGSITGVWAPKNTRGAIFDAMRARETFVTSGPRIKPRFFAGAGLAETDDPVRMVLDGYANGVPMGGSLSAHDRGADLHRPGDEGPDGGQP